MRQIVVPHQLLRSLLARLDGGMLSEVWCGVCESQPDVWLVRDISEPAPAESRGMLLRVATVDSGPEEHVRTMEHALTGARAVLLIGDNMARGRAWGAVQRNGGVEPLDLLVLPGAGMHHLHLETWPSAVLFRRVTRARTARDAVARRPEDTRWSRTISAVGGEMVWQRFNRLHIAIVGCGRSGSLAAVTLARLGARHLSLVDPDSIELHNLGEMDAVTNTDVGSSKAHTIAAHLHDIMDASRGSRAGPIFDSIIAPLNSREAHDACRQADVLICCVDNDAARLSLGMLATLHHKPLLDIGTGVRFSHEAEARSPTPDNRQMGADVRLIVPGSGCILCHGSLSDYPQAIVEAIGGRSPASSETGAWERERPGGSSRALNEIAVHHGIQLFLDLVAERVTRSVWARIEIDGTGRLSASYQEPTGNTSSCTLCNRAGLGDTAF